MGEPFVRYVANQRMRRTATILSGSACCVYGLTFTSHFYGARRTVGYVPFNSETLVKPASSIFDLACPSVKLLRPATGAFELF
mgnify:CR=1 FL=1